MNMQKYLFCAALLLALSACGGGDDDDAQTRVGGPSATNPIDVAPKPAGASTDAPAGTAPPSTTPPSDANATPGNTPTAPAPSPSSVAPATSTVPSPSSTAPAPAASTAPAASAARVVNPPAAQPVGALVSCYTVTGSLPLPAAQSPTLLPAPGTTLVTNYQELADPDSAGLCYANYQRELVGLPAFVTEAKLAQSSLNHSLYLTRNDFSGHDETPGNPGFTGKNAGARVTYVGYATNMVGEVLAMRMSWSAQSNATLALSPQSALLRSLFVAPFHRVGLLGSFKSAGSGYAQVVGPSAGSGSATDRPNSCQAGPACTYTAAEFYQTVNMADSLQSAADNYLIASPHDGQTDVPAQWKNTEWPNPSPGTEGKDIGYTVSLQAINRSLTLDADTFEIKDPSGASVPCFRLEHRTPSYQAGVDLAIYAGGMALCTPDAPLKAKTTYTVHVTGSLDSKPLDLTWSFTTQ